MSVNMKKTTDFAICVDFIVSKTLFMFELDFIQVSLQEKLKNMILVQFSVVLLGNFLVLKVYYKYVHVSMVKIHKTIDLR